MTDKNYSNKEQKLINERVHKENFPEIQTALLKRNMLGSLVLCSFSVQMAFPCDLERF